MELHSRLGGADANSYSKIKHIPCIFENDMLSSHEQNITKRKSVASVNIDKHVFVINCINSRFHADKWICETIMTDSAIMIM